MKKRKRKRGEEGRVSRCLRRDEVLPLALTNASEESPEQMAGVIFFRIVMAGVIASATLHFFRALEMDSPPAPRVVGFSLV